MAIMALVPWPTSRCRKSQCQSEKLGFLWKSRGTWIEEGCETRWLWFKRSKSGRGSFRGINLPRPAVERILAKSFSAKPGVEDRTKQRLLTMETCFWMLSTPIFVSHLVYNLCHTGKSVDD